MTETSRIETEARRVEAAVGCLRRFLELHERERIRSAGGLDRELRAARRVVSEYDAALHSVGRHAARGA
jgi:hypothetical protein